ncbi:MAG: 2-C-methyl-D-erythritol 4-phosphate cytidylyltransferase [Dehalococcoidales bacterium]|nr:2-C-methyl-D-erythritol 4-phosphate cytidylyltransferase [Dehalococcoidales bacterium]
MTDREKVSAIIVAAGDSQRMGGIDKLFAPLAGRPVLARVIDAFEACRDVDEIIIVTSQKNMERCRRLVAAEGWRKVREICPGGARRRDSVAEGLKRLANPDWVIIHDGARPLVTAELISRGLAAARGTGSATAAIPVSDTVKLAAPDGTVSQTLPRQNLRAVQTPQVFRYDIIKKAHENAAPDVTDDASLVEGLGYQVALYPGAYDNIKITIPLDLIIAEALLKARGQ